MFKYIRTLNTTATPEIMYVKTGADFAIVEGALFTVDEYGYAINMLSEFKPYYLALEEKVQDDTKTKIRCMRVSPDMLFEVDVFSDENTGVATGICVSIATDENSCYAKATLSSGSQLEIIDPNNYQKTAKLIVTFI